MLLAVAVFNSAVVALVSQRGVCLTAPRDFDCMSRKAALTFLTPSGCVTSACRAHVGLSADGASDAEEQIRELKASAQRTAEELAQVKAELNAKRVAEAAAEAAASAKAAMDAAAREQAAAAARVAEAQAEQDREALNKLFLSIAIDIIGMATYIVPVAGEAGDLAWAPISAYLIYQLYGNGVISGLAFAEELLPGLDIIPTATIAWILENTDIGRNFSGKSPSRSSPSDDGRNDAGGSGVDMKRADRDC